MVPDVSLLTSINLILYTAPSLPATAEYSKALPLLTLLTETHNFNQAGVWLKHAECHHMLNDLEQAALSYAKVLSLAPHHTETRMTLASLYSQLGMTEDALALLVAGEEVATVYMFMKLVHLLILIPSSQRIVCILSNSLSPVSRTGSYILLPPCLCHMMTDPPLIPRSVVHLQPHPLNYWYENANVQAMISASLLAPSPR